MQRRVFVRGAALAGAGAFLWSWYRQYKAPGVPLPAEMYHPDGDIPPGISHFGSYYLFRDSSGVSAFSTTCTHAGCRIGPSGGPVVTCGCHGSQFDAATGKPLRGPAYQPLNRYNCRFDQLARRWVVMFQTNQSKP